jgi:hypothetical protein
MNKNRRHELGKNRVAQIKIADIFYGALIGIVSVKGIWGSASLLIGFIL